MQVRNVAATVALLLLGALVAASPLLASEWANWRGPHRNGVSPETGLIASWSADGENLIWKADLIGRSTPAVFDGRACVTGRVGDGVDKQELVACFDAGTGKKLWEHRFNVFHTTVPFSRVGWTSPVGDPESGNLYVHGVGGQLAAFDKGGEVLWERSLTEEFGRFSGYGGRTHSPILDEDRVILGMSSADWGRHAPPRHRYYAFDKHSGELIWVSNPAGRPRTMTTYSTPVVTVIQGRRLLIGGNSDGHVYALKARTGEMVWKFELSKLGLNTSVAVDGTTVYATTGDEPVDEAIMGRVVAIDATGSGDVTKTHELWRNAGLKAKYASPLFHDGTLYIIDDSANLHALEADTGVERWVQNVGTVGKGSPVWADGKLYITEVNGNFLILKPGTDDALELDREQLRMEAEDRDAEIYGSPAVAYGRVYFTAENGLYCLGNAGKPFAADAGTPPALAAEKPAADGKPAWLQVVPAETEARPGEPVRFRAIAYDANGLRLSEVKGDWTVDGLAATVDGKGKLTPEVAAGGQAGLVKVSHAGLQGLARVRVLPDLPYSEDFETVEIGKNPSFWLGARDRFVVEEKDGGRVLIKPFKGRGLERQNAYLGASDMTGYTIQADMMGTLKGRRRPDMGLIAGRYTLDLQGNHQRLQIRDWAELRFEKTIDFPWETDVWYRMKMRADPMGDKTVIKGKVWVASEPEPADWTLVAEDPVPNRQGSPGLYGYSPTTVYYDNVKITVSQ